MSTRIPLPSAPHEIAALTGAQPPSYQALYRAALAHTLPSAERSNTGRWTVSVEALPEIAKIFASGPQPIWPGTRDEAVPCGRSLPKGRRRRASAPAAIAA